MADEANIPTHRWYQQQNHIKLPMQDVSESVIYTAGIAKIDQFMITVSSNALFAAGEVGVWYDPSDLTTLFQDSAGTTPVTAAGQPVGLMLDKSKGLALGAEILPNGDFSQGSTGWSVGTGWSVSGGVATHAGELGVLLSTPATAFTIGLSYIIEFDYSGNTGPFAIYLRGANVINGNINTASGHFKGIGVAGTSTSEGLSILATANLTIDNVSVKLLAGNHAKQATSPQRPTYQIDGTGRPYLSFDGVDDGMATSAIDFSATDAVTVFTGLRKLSDANVGTVVELTAAAEANNGSFYFRAPTSNGGANYQFWSQGTLPSQPAVFGIAAPDTAVITLQGKISADTAIIRRNGAQVAFSSADQGTGNYANAPLYIGRRGGASIPFNGNIYSLIVRGAQSTAGQITSTETWVNGKTGAY